MTNRRLPFRALIAAFAVQLVLLTSWSLGQPKQAPVPLGASAQKGGVAFRVWAPFVDAVAVKVNGGVPVPLLKEAGHAQADDTVWTGAAPGAKVGDSYR